MLSNKRDPVIEEFPKHEKLVKNKLQSLNPLTLFPSKKDTLTKAFFTVDVPLHVIKKEKKERWLDPEYINPEFGIKVIIFSLSFFLFFFSSLSFFIFFLLIFFIFFSSSLFLLYLT